MIRLRLPQSLRPHRALENERGSTILLVAISTTALLSMVALAIDMGMLFTARGEAQRVADSAALAGAGAIIFAPPGEEETRARNTAIEYGALNDVRKLSVVLEPEDVEVNMADRTVTVTVRRTAERGNAIGTWFAHIFDIDEVDVVAQATAQVVPGGGASCMKPFTVPDAWEDENENELYEDPEFYDPAVTGYGTDFRNGVPSDNDVDPPGTTYEYDFGRPLVLHPGKPQEAIVSSWYFPYDVPTGNEPDVGGDRYRWNIANCNTSIVSVGQEYMPENGNMAGPTRAGSQELMEKDKDAYFDINVDSVVGSIYQPWEASPRVGNMPLFDPRLQLEPGKRPIVFNNIIAFWIDDVQGNEVIGRFLNASGAVVGSPGVGNNTGPGLDAVRLID